MADNFQRPGSSFYRNNEGPEADLLNKKTLFNLVLYLLIITERINNKISILFLGHLIY